MASINIKYDSTVDWLIFEVNTNLPKIFSTKEGSSISHTHINFKQHGIISPLYVNKSSGSFERASFVEDTEEVSCGYKPWMKEQVRTRIHVESLPSTIVSILETLGSTMSRLPNNSFKKAIIIPNCLSLKHGKGIRHKRPKIKGSISRIITFNGSFEKLSCHHFSTTPFVQVLRLRHCQLSSNELSNMGIIFI
uniref:Uncharacterized protein n=1 Tax=Cannabis sativa TaxID=3483 RepID=A0A803QBN8_CANSA